VSGSPPAATRRLFWGYGDDAWVPPDNHFALERLLEDGDSADLGWLAGRFPERRLAGWVAGAGGRRLSRRSRAFWELVLGVEAGRPPAPAAELWPR
jgi:hypothetical protein